MASSRKRSSSKRTQRHGTLVFQRRNYLLIILGLSLVIVGFALMRIDNQFEGFLSLYVAPLIILGGYLEIIYAILWRPATDDSEAATPSDASQQEPTG